MVFKGVDYVPAAALGNYMYPHATLQTRAASTQTQLQVARSPPQGPQVSIYLQYPEDFSNMYISKASPVSILTISSSSLTHLH
jgi:hypothetical protein